MSVTALPTSPNLEYYRKQAKALLHSCKSGDLTSVDRVRALIPRLDPADIALNDTQWIIAREHGFQSWAKFKEYIESVGANGLGPSNIDDLRQPLEEARKPAKKAAASANMKGNSTGSDAVKAKTGKSWDEWFAILDEAGCATMSHKEIVAVVSEHGVGSWWRQMVTVEYERARGNRVMFQGCDGDFRSNASKTLNVPVQIVFDAWNEADERAKWLGNETLTIRKATSPKSLRITWGDGTNLDVNLFPKGESKASCAVECAKLSGPNHVEERKVFWAAALDRLKVFLEG